MKRAKMMRKHQARGRCSVQYHGSWCCVAEEIQDGRASRARSIEKREWKKEVWAAGEAGCLGRSYKAL